MRSYTEIIISAEIAIITKQPMIAISKLMCYN